MKILEDPAKNLEDPVKILEDPLKILEDPAKILKAPYQRILSTLMRMSWQHYCDKRDYKIDVTVAS